ncbi:hypothetical protein ABW20_dc0105312 [Dactylellina cionopaga]|nr:hypothetical protein ABW20_dc0105312 [Dactylellina cionopaga]
MTLPPKESPKYAVRTMTCSTPGVYHLGGESYQINTVPTEIEYAKEVSRSFAACKAHEYFKWMENNNERATNLKAAKNPGGKHGLLSLPGGVESGLEVVGLRHKSTPNRLAVDYIRCDEDTCTTESQKWSVGYRAEVRKRVFASEFSGLCDGKGPCELCAVVAGHKFSITVTATTPGPCTTSTTITTEETITNTITRTRTVSTTVHAAQTEDARAKAGAAAAETAASVTTQTTPALVATESGASTTLSSTTPPSSTDSIQSSVSSSPTVSSNSAAPTDPTQLREALSTHPKISAFRVIIRPSSPPERLLRRQNAPWYVRVYDNTMYVETEPSNAAVFSISDQQLEFSDGNHAFAASDDLVARGPILIGGDSGKPSTVFSIDPNTGALIWKNEKFKRGTAAFCMDDDEAINGVYAGPIDVLCEEVELTAEFIDSSNTSNAATSTSVISSSMTTSESTVGSSGTTSALSESTHTSVSSSESVTTTSSSLPPTATTSSLSTSGSQSATSSSLPQATVSVEEISPPSSKCPPVQIQNSGFESGKSTPWSPTSIEGEKAEFVISTAHPNKDTHSLLIHLPPASSATLSQTLVTCQGSNYSGSVWLDLAIEGKTEICSLFILINNVAVAEQGATAGKYVKVPFEFTAATTSTTLTLLAHYGSDKEASAHKQDGGGEDADDGLEGGKEGKEGEKEEKEEGIYGILMEIWHFVKMLGDIVERLFVLVVGEP